MLLFLMSRENDCSFEVLVHFVDLLQDLIESLPALARATFIQIVCRLSTGQGIFNLSLKVPFVYTNFLSLSMLYVLKFGGCDFFCLIIAIRSTRSWKVAVYVDF